ncbi:unnamed protein product [Amoebophrya sp. A25]|nr:unnamed protein product [Amoebophrya sp. A25]|eukprot:GSA25T00001040001.1
MEMERQLRDVLDAASFDRAVIRVGNGIYNFGSDRCILRLDVDNRVLASSGDDGASFIPVADFIRKLSTTPTPIQEQGVEENAAGATTAGVRRTSSLQDAGATPQGPPATSTVQRKGILNYQQPKLTSVSIGSPQLSANRMAAMEPMPFYAQPHRSTSSEPVVKDKPFVGGGVSSRPSEVLSLAGRQSREASPQPVVGDAMRSWVGRERQAGPPVSQILLNFGQPPRTLSASPLRTTQQTRRHP